ncbi:MAG TPA: sugar transferase, partial [Anaerolineales bacterium]|nr:sugar transferase [Anaerolineales bacterium]
MLRRFSVNFALFSMLLDTLSIVFSLWLAAVIRPLLNGLLFFRDVGSTALIPYQLYILFPVLWVIVFASLSIYDGRKFLRAPDELAALLLSTLLASISAAGILYLSFREISRVLFVIFVSCAFAICMAWRVLARIYFRGRPESSAISRRLLVVGIGSLGESVGKQIRESRSESLSFVGFVDDGYSSGGGPYLGKAEDLKTLIPKCQATDVVIALPYSQYHKMSEIVQALEDQPVGVWIALGFFDLALYRTDIEDFAGIPMLDLRASAIDDYQRMIKRVFDLLFGLLLMIPSLPLMMLSALMIYLDDGAPIFFRQKRVGENGRLFEMLKFRTMVRNAEQLQAQVEQQDVNGNQIFKTKGDPRVTRMGRLLRRFSLDELPQLFNVIEGKMSLVGPRPELPSLVEKYQPWQRKRFAVPPGLTGWWQVNGRSDKPMHL